MSASSGVQPPQTRRFAAKYHHRTWGVTLGSIGVLSLLAGFGEGAPGAIIFGLILVAAAVYLLRGHGIDPKIGQRKAATMAQSTDALQRAVQAGQRGAAVVAYRNLVATAQRVYRQEAPARVGEALASVGVDARSLESPRIGVIPTLRSPGQVEVYRDWIIYGQEAHDVDATTRGDVHVDGSVQMVQNARHDMRTAELQFVSTAWSMGAPIDPDQANEARRVVAQLAAQVESLKPKGVTAQDMRAMVDTILNNTGQPPAEKLQQLSNLRYARLLSDDEFEQAKSKILGIG